MKAKRRTTVAVAALWWGMAAVTSGLGGNAHAGVRLGVQFPPAVQPMEQGSALVYELDARNFDAACVRLVDVKAEAGDVQQRYQGATIARNALVYDAQMQPLRNPAPGETSMHSVDIPQGGGIVLYFFLTLSDGMPVPASLRHTLAFTDCDDAATERRTVVDESAIRSGAPIVIGMPFRGANWVATDSVNAGGTHRRTLIPLRDAQGNLVAGEFHVPERYAIDWVVVDEEARRAVGPLDRNDSYLAYGREIVAVADGIVSATRDGMAENAPPFNPPNATVEMAAGNFIMQDIGGGHYAFYAHLQPGSLRVSEGQRVARGQTIALLGNSGNSSEPHLHFHVSNANDPLLSEGLPYVFDCFHSVGQTGDLDEENGLFDDFVRYAPRKRLSAMPRSDSIVDADPELIVPYMWWYFRSVSVCSRMPLGRDGGQAAGSRR
ncbi:M23 family metallopeptidase [Dokdonella sp.]|uniref:M23 family metallopeptidase n=1 Tax=Dokdonella sp. TaxID=2291710 RepID=UPI002619C4F1|nr:M23 family metallopeptidase [Dokdonella sp.]